MSYTDVIEEIENLPHYREYTCKHCNHKQKIYSLTIQAECKLCKKTIKLRGFGSVGSEIEDVVDTVLAWLGTDNEFRLAMERKQMIDSSS